MKKSFCLKICVILCFFFFPFFAFSVTRGNQELVPAGSWVYDNLFSISVESGIINFADNAPLSVEEIKVYLSEIDYDSLSSSGKKQYDEIQKYFDRQLPSFDSGFLSFAIEPSLNLSGFYKTNDDLDWVYDRYERRHFLDVPLSLNCGNYLTLKMDTFLGMNKSYSLHNNVYSNIPLGADYIDINFPDEGYLSTGYVFGKNTGINFQLGKGERNIGRTLTGSMIWSRYLTGVSYGSLTLYSPNIRYTGNVSQFGVDRYMYYHEFEGRFFRKFTFTALEGMFINAPMELRFLNPFTIFHGMAPWREYEPEEYDAESHICAYLGIKFQYVPVKNLRIYGLYAMTQFQTPFEVNNYPNDVTPNGIGGQLGSELFIPLKDGKLYFGIEGSYAQPYLYIKEGPNWTLVKTYYENSGDKRHPFYEWIGSPFGPDTVSCEFKAEYSVPHKYSLGLVYLLMARGEMSEDRVFTTMAGDSRHPAWGGVHTPEKIPDDWCYPDKERQGIENAKHNQKLVTPTGIPENVNRLSVRGTYWLNDKTEITLQPSYVLIFNNDHKKGNTQQGIEIACAVSYKF